MTLERLLMSNGAHLQSYRTLREPDRNRYENQNSWILATYFELTLGVNGESTELACFSLLAQTPDGRLRRQFQY